jgi:hypothetical protein
MAAAGLPFGTRGIATTPAPSRPRALEDLDDPVRAVPADRAVGRLAAVLLAPAVAADVRVDGMGAAPGGGGAVPQTSQ